MKVLCCGSRGWTDRKIIHEALKDLPEGAVIVNGGNGSYDRQARQWSGADVLTTQFGLVHGYEVREYPVSEADWKQLGLKAGPLRNLKMLDREHTTEEPIEAVYAFRLAGPSKGTDHMVAAAQAAGIPVYLYELDRDGTLLPSYLVPPAQWEQARLLLDSRSSDPVE